MERKPYSAGAVKFSFWFMEFRKTVQLLSEGKSFADIKKLNEETNIYGAPTKLRAQQIYSTVTARIKTLDESFYPIFLSSDLATQKLFVLTAALLHDTLFFDFVYAHCPRSSLEQSYHKPQRRQGDAVLYRRVSFAAQRGTDRSVQR